MTQGDGVATTATAHNFRTQSDVVDNGSYTGI